MQKNSNYMEVEFESDKRKSPDDWNCCQADIYAFPEKIKESLNCNANTFPRK